MYKFYTVYNEHDNEEKVKESQIAYKSFEFEKPDYYWCYFIWMGMGEGGLVLFKHLSFSKKDQ